MSKPSLIQQKPFLHIPETVSKEAQEFLRNLKDPAQAPAFPDPGDLTSWKKVQAFVEKDALAQSEAIVKRYAPTVTERSLGGVQVLDVRPKGWTENAKVVVYVHGGAHTLYSAKSTSGRAAIFANDTGHRVISVDYTLAPEAKFNQMSDEVIAVIKALLTEGHALNDVLIYGDSSGGGLAAAAVLKMRDQRLGMPVAAVLVSPWVDVTRTGDTEFTLAQAEPNYLYEKHSKNAAGAYADPEDQKHPYASPVYGDFSKGFPPTLIQGGTKEILLSGFIRLYQALDTAGLTVKLDIYEGMPHNFASRIPEAPESKVARKKIQDFVRVHLGEPQRAATKAAV
jgi:epsilon-lactone hydrolase